MTFPYSLSLFSSLATVDITRFPIQNYFEDLDPDPADVVPLLGRWWSEGNEFVFWWEDGTLQAKVVESPRGRGETTAREVEPGDLDAEARSPGGAAPGRASAPAASESAQMPAPQ